MASHLSVNVGDRLVFKRPWTGYQENVPTGTIVTVDSLISDVGTIKLYCLRFPSGRVIPNWDIPVAWFDFASDLPVILTDEEFRSAQTLPSFDDLENYFRRIK